MLTIATSDDFYETQSDILMAMDEIIPEKYNRELMLDPGFNEPYPLSWTTVTYGQQYLLNSWSAGRMFVNYLDHGNYAYWANPDFYYDDINSPTYNNRLPFVLSTACFTGGFDVHQSSSLEDCMAERFLCRNSSRGAIGFFGSAIETSSSTFHYNTLFYNSFINNYALVMGESIFESKLKIKNHSTGFGLYDYNLFGDPALNLSYENIIAILPDLYVKQSQIEFTPQLPNHGDEVNISAVIKNGMIGSFSETFNVSCYAKNKNTGESTWIGNAEVNGMNSSFEEVMFTWNTSTVEPGNYNFRIEINADIDNAIIELNEENNYNFKDLVLYNYNPNLQIQSPYNSNSHPVSFNLNDNYVGDEIVFGEKIISANGEIIEINSGETTGLTSVANLYNDDENYIIQVNKQSLNSTINAYGNMSWSYPLVTISNVGGPVIADFETDGYEEVVLSQRYGDHETLLICLNHDGLLRWEYNNNDLFPVTPVFCNMENEEILILFENTGNVLFMKENNSSNGLIEFESVQIGDFNRIIGDPKVSDIDKGGYLELLFLLSLNNGEKVLSKINFYDMGLATQNLGNINFFDFLLSDINNTGLSEIVLGAKNDGVYIFDASLNSFNYISVANLYYSDLVTGDFNADGKNDIVLQLKEPEFNALIKIIDFEGNNVFTAPLVTIYEDCWISDINKDQKNDILLSRLNNLYAIDLPYYGQSLGWPGQQGNVRNTGVYEQPAYFGNSGETVYWSNTISLSPDVDNIIPKGSTVIIKPGTKIKAHVNAGLIVHGTLVSEGSENYPVVFSADINGATKGYWRGITIANKASASFKHCEIQDAYFGILTEDDSKATILNCKILNNSVGVGAFNSEPYIKDNYITNNDVGVGSYKNGSPVMSDINNLIAFRNGIINNSTGIEINDANIFMNNGGNDIYNSPPCGYYVRLSFDFGIYYVYATNNYWGTPHIEEIEPYLNPSSLIIIDPICTVPQSPYVPSGDEKTEMLKDANTAKENGEYPSAENTYKAIIQQYPESQEAYLSVSGIFESVELSDGEMQNLETYYDGLYADTTLSPNFKKLVLGYINLCKREQAKFAEAISNYESIILDDPSYNDSVYAVIDIGNTYEEAGNYKSTLGQLSYLVPASRARHIEKTVDLLLSLHLEDNHNTLDNSSLMSINAYPNPVKGNLIIEYELSVESNVGFSIYDILGKEVMRKNEGFKSSGQYVLDYDMSELKPGVYYLSVSLEGNQAYSTKIVKR